MYNSCCQVQLIGSFFFMNSQNSTNGIISLMSDQIISGNQKLHTFSWERSTKMIFSVFIYQLKDELADILLLACLRYG